MCFYLEKELFRHLSTNYISRTLIKESVKRSGLFQASPFILHSTSQTRVQNYPHSQDLISAAKLLYMMTKKTQQFHMFMLNESVTKSQRENTHTTHKPIFRAEYEKKKKITFLHFQD